MSRSPIYVARPHLPDLADVIPLLEEIWDNRILSNNGPVLLRFESALSDYLGVEHISLVANATLGTVLAMQQAGVTSGEVITTPFSFVATSNAITLAGATPVFADLDPVTLNLDPTKIEALITPQTKALLPVHIFGVPCDIDGLAEVADRHGLKVLYDAAHAFGVHRNGQSILGHGDMSVLSFHATKVFNTFEGGAVISQDRETKLAIDSLANFGLANVERFNAIGTNAKMNEFSAAVGLAQLCGIDEVLSDRARVAQRYTERLSKIRGLSCPCLSGVVGHNHYAFPILIDSTFHISRDELQIRLEEVNVFARKYFSPLISDIEPYKTLSPAGPAGLPVARKIASEVLCLPIYPDLDAASQDRIIERVLEC